MPQCAAFVRWSSDALDCAPDVTAFPPSPGDAGGRPLRGLAGCDDEEVVAEGVSCGDAAGCMDGWASDEGEAGELTFWRLCSLLLRVGVVLFAPPGVLHELDGESLEGPVADESLLPLLWRGASCERQTSVSEASATAKVLLCGEKCVACGAEAELQE